MKTFFKIISILIFLAVLGVGFSFYAAVNMWKSPVAAELDIAPGSSVKRIARQLEEKQVIRTPHMFSAWVRLNNWESKLAAGYYEFDANMSLREVVNKIRKGEVKAFTFQVIEGTTLKDIAANLAKQDFIPGQIAGDFLKLARDKTFLKKLGFKNIPSLEGYIMADTYQISKPRSAEAIIKEFLKLLPKFYNKTYEQRAKALGMTRHDVLTLASIVEKETGKAEERPLVASVFHNRLKKRMFLQSDPTIIYGLPNYDGNIRKKDITNPHRYNTYVHAGLPPGPIASVGREAIEAVLYPKESSYLYFVSRGDGSHKFSHSLSEHLQAVMEYQIKPHRKK